MRIGMEVGLGPGDIVLARDPAPPTERSTADTQFLVDVCCSPLRYRDGAGNTVEENSSVFSLIQIR